MTIAIDVDYLPWRASSYMNVSGCVVWGKECSTLSWRRTVLINHAGKFKHWIYKSSVSTSGNIAGERGQKHKIKKKLRIIAAP